MTVPKDEFAAWIEWARTRVGEAGVWPLIDEKVHNFDLLCDAYSDYSDNAATRDHLARVQVSAGS